MHLVRNSCVFEIAPQAVIRMGRKRIHEQAWDIGRERLHYMGREGGGLKGCRWEMEMNKPGLDMAQMWL